MNGKKVLLTLQQDLYENVKTVATTNMMTLQEYILGALRQDILAQQQKSQQTPVRMKKHKGGRPKKFSFESILTKKHIFTRGGKGRIE